MIVVTTILCLFREENESHSIIPYHTIPYHVHTLSTLSEGGLVILWQELTSGC
jgi:hypothetical protein